MNMIRIMMLYKCLAVKEATSTRNTAFSLTAVSAGSFTAFTTTTALATGFCET